MGIETRTLTQNEQTIAQQQAEAIANAGSSAISEKQFTFFAAFDGTNNQRNNLGLSGDPQMSNVAQLELQVKQQVLANTNLSSNYYPGPGTDGTLFASSWYPPQVTQQVINTAKQAYDQFGRDAADWLANNPGGSVTAAMTAFSRGNASMVLFAQMLNEQGLVDPRNGVSLIPPGQVPVTFQNWYAARPSRPVLKLQVIAEAMTGFEAGGADPLLDQKVESFNFAGLANAFDAARKAAPSLNRWSLTQALLNFQLAGSDNAAIGGDLAYQYGKTGALSGVSLSAAEALISDRGFGAKAQTLQAPANLQEGALRLG